MNLTKEEIDRIAQATAEKMQSTCACGLSAQAQAEVSHFMGMAKDIGKGDRARGIETMRETFKAFERWRKLEHTVGVTIVRALVIAIFGAVMAFFGLKAVQ